MTSVACDRDRVIAKRIKTSPQTGNVPEKDEVSSSSDAKQECFSKEKELSLLDERKIYFNNDITDAFEKSEYGSCSNCHGGGGSSGGVIVDAFDEFRLNFESIKTSIENGSMPPAGSLPSNKKTELIALLNKWFSDGKLSQEPVANDSETSADSSDDGDSADQIQETLESDNQQSDSEKSNQEKYCVAESTDQEVGSVLFSDDARECLGKSKIYDYEAKKCLDDSDLLQPGDHSWCHSKEGGIGAKFLELGFRIDFQKQLDEEFQLFRCAMIGEQQLPWVTLYKVSDKKVIFRVLKTD